MYKRLAEVRSDENVEALREEMLDRYGPHRHRCTGCCSWRASGPGAVPPVSEVTVQGKYVRFHPVELPESGSCG